jgi:hypothetical protein
MKSSGNQFLFLILLICSTTISAQDMTQEINFSEHKYLPGYGLKKLAHPEMFQGNRKKKKLF